MVILGRKRFRGAWLVGLALAAAMIFGPLSNAASMLAKGAPIPPAQTAPAPAAPSGLVTVNSLADPGSGGCTLAECTLREAIAAAAAGDTVVFAPGLAGGTITLSSGELAIGSVITIDGAAAPGLKIDGNNASRIFAVGATGTLSVLNLTLQRGKAPSGSTGGALRVQSGTALISNTLVLSSTATNGGGIRNERASTGSPAGVLTVVNSVVRGNSASNNGGGISTSSSTTTIVQSAVISNTAQGTSTTVVGGGSSGLGGGLHHVNAGSPLPAWTTVVTNTTVAGNQGNGGAAAYVDNNGRLELYHSTVADNRATNAASSQVGGLFLGNTGSNGQLLRLRHTLVADNTASDVTTRGPDLGQATGLSITSGGYTLIESGLGATVGGTTTGNITGLDPRLGPLAFNGGATPSMLIDLTSPARNAGDPAFAPPPATDQRGPGFPRVLNGRVDIGAIEVLDVTQTSSPYIVNSLGDPGSGGCTLAECTLREAIAAAAAGDTVVFAPGLAGGTITLSSGELVIAKLITIDGAAVPGLKIDGNNASRIFAVGATGTLSVLNLTLQRGKAPSGSTGGALRVQSGTALISNTLVLSSTATNGGGIRNERASTGSPAGVLTLVNSVVRGNSASNNGGGISTSSSTTTIVQSAVISNTAQGTSATVVGGGSSGLGGGLHHVNAGSPLPAWTTVVTNTTVAGNQGNGGAAAYVDNNGRLELYHSTVAGNRATNAASSQVGGLFLGNTGSNGQLLRLRHTLVADNTASDVTTRGPDLGQATGLSITSGGYSLIESVLGATIGGTTTGNLTGLDPKLGPLAFNGGATPTMALLAGSPALNAGDPAFAPPPATDQRGPGFLRAVGRVDIGAYEGSDAAQTASPLLVTSAADPGDGVCTTGECTLREALTLANTLTGTTTINFGLPGSGLRTIAPLAPLPAITRPVVIDGSSQPGASCPGTPLVELNGAGAGSTANGLDITAGGSTVRGLVINRFAANGIRLSAGGGNTVQCSLIGSNPAGAINVGNGQSGVAIVDSVDNTIGGTSAAARNVISGNSQNGVAISGASSGNAVQGNYIGANAAGTAALGNVRAGVLIDGGRDNTIGGTSAAARNVIAANGSDGVAIMGAGATGNAVQGNYIGTNAAGTAALGNGTSGVYVFNQPDSVIGGAVAGAGNVISANGGDGVYLAGASASGTLVAGNTIGLDAAGSASLGNAYNGIVINGAVNSTIGGTSAAARNVIAANGANGINIVTSGGGATGNVVQGNYIGTDAGGTLDRGNAQSGVRLSGAASNTIGGAVAGAGNVISGNTFNGVVLENANTGNNTVAGNRIGTNAAGTAAIANSQNGVSITNGGFSNTIGGTAAGAGNVISGNTIDGVSITTAASSGNRVQGNRIGTDAAASAALPNARHGVFINNSSDNIVGSPAAGNVISGNAVDGVSINGTATGTLVQGNSIGTDATGLLDRGNGASGVIIGTSAGHTIGGTLPGAGNLISGNTVGVVLQGAASSGNRILGNRIGTDATGLAALGNNSHGLTIDGAKDNLIGGTDPAARNVISGNGNNGINMFTAGASGNLIQGNYIGLGADGATDLGNFQSGIRMSRAANNTVGGAAAGAGNVIAGNGQHGVIVLNPEATGNVIAGNIIGRNAANTLNVANTLDGVQISDASANQVGLVGAGNVIAGNGGAGVSVLTASAAALNNPILNNAIFGNGGLGIDLGPAGPTANDPGDADSGANGLQNFPILALASEGSGATGVAGTLDSMPNTAFRLEFFAQAACDGEGETYLGAASVRTDGSGMATFSASLPVAAPAGRQITATATDQAGNTSEFSACVAVSAAPSLSISDVTVDEGDSGPTPAVFTVSLSAASAQTVTVSYATADVTANAPADYAAAGNTLVFAPLQTSRAITVDVLGDPLDEPDERFAVLLSAPVGASLADDRGEATIRDDDAAPALSLQDASVIEGDSGPTAMLFTVGLSAASAQTVTVSYATADDSASAPADYAAASGMITLAPFETNRTIAVTVNGDLFDESDETFTLTLSAPGNASLSDGAAVGTIRDDDAPPPVLTIADLAIDEGDSGPTTAVFSLTLSAPSKQVITVAYATADDSATAPADYLAAGGMVVFEPSQQSAVITVTINGDTLPEPDETFGVTLSEPSGASLGDGAAVGTIRNDDGARLFLPLVVASADPDLVVKSLVASPTGVSVVIKNQGTLAVSQPFWVDVYINPAVVPTVVNQTWELVGAQGGLAWGLQDGALPLDPGEELTLTIGDAFYQPAYSRWPGTLPAGTTLYAQVDSASQGSSFGAILEADEQPGATYNNIFGPLVTTLDVWADATPAARPAGPGALPARP